MRFTKMHGIGNDYVFVDCFLESILRPEKTAHMISDRHFGIGSDGLILIKPSVKADFEMVMYNADGSRGEMCGNGIRCMAKYVYEKGLTDKTCITIETLAGIRTLWMNVEKGTVTAVKVDMGSPIWEPELIPVLFQEKMMIRQPVRIENRPFFVTCVSMGNPHCVVFMEESVESMKIENIGRLLECHEMFPKRTNVEFVNILSKRELRMRVWERGSGETLACGTGACAVAAAAIVNGYADTQVRIHLSGGELEIFWDRKEDRIYMTGSAVQVYEGDFRLPKGFEIEEE